MEGILDYDIVDPETLLMKRKKAKQSPNMIKALVDRWIEVIQNWHDRQIDYLSIYISYLSI